MKRILCSCFVFMCVCSFCFANVSVVGSLSREKQVEPGEKFKGNILLKNTGQKSYQVKVYQTDYLFYADGRTVYDEPGTIPRSNAHWVSFNPTQLTIPPKQTAALHYMVQVPSRLALKGTYWSIMMIEPMTEAHPENVTDKNKETGMRLRRIVRYGFQMITHIGDTGAQQIQFLEKKLTQKDGKQILEIVLENIGERMLVPLVWAELYDKDGANIGRFESQRWRIYPTCSVKHQMDLTHVPKGGYKALVIVDDGGESVFGAQYDLEIEQ